MQLKRWVEHYSKLYSEEKPVDPHLEYLVPKHPAVEEPDDEEKGALVLSGVLQMEKQQAKSNILAEVLKENIDTILPPQAPHQVLEIR